LRSILLCSLLAASLVRAGEQPVFWVAPGGDDAGPGSEARPFGTLGRARDALRALRERPAGPLVVRLRAGVYHLPEPLVLTPDDSGTARSPVVYAAAPGERVTLSGALRLAAPAWEAWRGEVRRGKVALPAGCGRLWADGVPLVLARYPDARPGRVLGGGAADALDPERVRRWSRPAGAWVHALAQSGVGSLHWRVTGVGPDGRPTLEGGWQLDRGARMHDERRVFENVREELDAPGEWYADQAEGWLYCQPPAGLDLSRATLEAARLRGLVEIRGSAARPVRFVALRGLRLAQTERTCLDSRESLGRGDVCFHRGGAVLVEGAEDCAVDDCAFEDLGGNGLCLSRYCRRVTVQGCRFAGLDAVGVLVVGAPGCRRSLATWAKPVPLGQVDRAPGPQGDDFPAACTVVNSLFTELGRLEKHAAGIYLATCADLTLRHNTITRVPAAGIALGDGAFGGHVLEHNEITEAALEVVGAGALVALGRDRGWGVADPAAARELSRLDAVRPTEVRGNRLRCEHGWDLALGDGASQYQLQRNLCLAGGLKLGPGYGRLVENNLIVGGLHPQLWPVECGDEVARNVFVGGPPYRGLGADLRRAKSLDHNIFVGWTEHGLKLLAAGGTDAHSELASAAMFVDAAAGDYTAKPDSAALRLGWRNFPLDRCGVQKPVAGR
jgi:hypothetical protein